MDRNGKDLLRNVNWIHGKATLPRWVSWLRPLHCVHALICFLLDTLRLKLIGKPRQDLRVTERHGLLRIRNTERSLRTFEHDKVRAAPVSSRRKLQMVEAFWGNLWMTLGKNEAATTRLQTRHCSARLMVNRRKENDAWRGIRWFGMVVY